MPPPFSQTEFIHLVRSLASLDSGGAPVAVLAIPIRDFEVSHAARFLTQEEQDRAARFMFAADRRRFVAAMACLRSILSVACDTAPAMAPLKRTDLGKPYLPDSAFQFNVSHAGDVVLIGLAHAVAIGVDLEPRSAETRVTGLARAILSATELRRLSNSPDAPSSLSLLRTWTRKEAVSKAIGLGLSLPFPSFDIIESGSTLMVEAHQSALRQNPWTCCDLDLGPSYIGAVATAAPVPHRMTAFVDWRHIIGLAGALRKPTKP